MKPVKSINRPARYKRLLITAGPTREMLDPVRFLSNLSTGEMGYTLARVAKAKGYKVTLISGPTMLKPPAGIRFLSITSARELQKICAREFPKQDALVMTAAVCDFTARKMSRQKILRTRTHRLHLTQTPDIVQGLAKGKGEKVVIGFCLETSNWIRNARNKIVRKNLDGIVANYYTAGHNPFGKRRINTAFLDSSGRAVLFKRQSKAKIAVNLLCWMESMKRNS
jgi:phosphopantothenoylcysteine decarboxylase / phosphopantothenate---cysteine ligase